MSLSVYTHKTGVVYSSDEGTLTQLNNAYTGNEEVGIKFIVPAGTTDKALTMGVTKANVVSMMLDATVPLTVKTYLATVLKDTFTLLAKNMVIWNDTLTTTIPLTANFDQIKVTNSGIADGTFQARFLSNE